MGEVKAIRQFCFAMEIRGSERHLLGDKDYSLEREANSY